MFQRSIARALIKTVWAGVLRACGLLWLTKRWARRNGIIVLTLHRILSDQEIAATASLPGMIVRRETFDQFLSYAEHNLQVVDLAGDLAGEIAWEPRKHPAIALTFDDGWCDNAEGAFQIAQKHRSPMTIFIVPERAGAAMPFWPEQAASVLGTCVEDEGARHTYLEQVIEQLKLLPEQQRDQEMEKIFSSEAAHMAAATVDRTMTWQEIERLHAAGVTFGSHTCTHEILTRIPPERAEEQITHSRQEIQERLGRDCTLFAYPNGNSSPQVRGIVRRAGYKLAFINDWPVLWTRDSDPFQVPRVNICEYHLIGLDGKFSPLVFEYAVVWKSVRNAWVMKVGRWLGAKADVSPESSEKSKANLAAN